MNNYERLLQEAADSGVFVHEAFDLNSDSTSSERVNGLYMDGYIALDSGLDTTAERAGTLAEELGHHYTSHGNIMNMDNVNSRQQEYDARLWGYDNLIGLLGIIRAFEHGCRNRYDTAEYLEVAEEYLEEALKCYRSKYGVYKVVDNYAITFIPNLTVTKLF